MLLSDPKVLFYHIPKTAGDSIESAFLAQGGKVLSSNVPFRHYSLERLLRDPKASLARAQLPSFFKFSVVRNPFDRVVSTFFHLKWCRNINFSFSTYLRWIVEYLQLLSDAGHNLMQPVSIGRFRCKRHAIFDRKHGMIFDVRHVSPLRYWFNFRDPCEIDYLLRFERLDHDWDCVKKRFNLPDLPHLNANPLRVNSKDYRSVYAQQDEKLVARLYSEEIEFFGYSF